jgi:hypothetical protein
VKARTNPEWIVTPRRSIRLIVAIAMAIPIVLALFTATQYCRSTVPVVFLWPGEFADLLVEGGHGGTMTEQHVGAALNVLVNIVVYTAVSFALLTVVAMLTEQGRRWRW